MTRAFVCSLLLAVVGCGMDFRPPSLVPRARLVGVRVEIAGAPERAAPLPGETFDAVPIVLSNDGASPLTTAWFACGLLPSRTGVPACAGGPLATGDAVLGAAPTMRVFLPPDLPARGVFSLLFAIASCDEGALPVLPEDTTGLPSCAGGGPDARAELSVFTVPIATDPALANRHPDLRDETITLTSPDGAERTWAAPSGPSAPDGCALLPDEPGLPHLALPVAPEGMEVDPERLTFTFSITSSPDDRERYVEVLPGNEPPSEAREVLQISHYLTAGTFERQFSAFEGLEDALQPSSVDWDLPAAEEVPDGGLLVRVWWVARDLRGGMALTERRLCVVPPG